MRKKGSAASRGEWVAAGLLLLCLILAGLGGRCHVLGTAVRWELAVYPGLTEQTVIARLGPPTRRIEPGAGRGPLWGYEPRPVLPIERGVLVYEHLMYAFAVYIGQDGKVVCTVLGMT
ncbi:MAG: hypothetical protein HUU35_04985 [Armatimonadetes bacterium]|nr:hypothetical protein [Armatimonadota bacterium]